MKNRDHVVSIRLTADEYEEIREFLSRNPKFKKISELFRHALMEYISKFNNFQDNIVKYDKDMIIEISLSPALEKLVENLVDYGIFRNMSDARKKIINYLELKIPSVVREFLVEQFRANYSFLKEHECDIVRLEKELGIVGGGRNER